MEAMRYSHEKLIASLEKLKAASLEARKIRDAADGEMQKLVTEMGEAAAATSMRT